MTGVPEMHRLLPAGVLVLAGVVDAAPRMLVVAAGDCQDAAFAATVADVHRGLEELGGEVFEPDVVLDIVRPRPLRALEEVVRQVESARTLFYGDQPDRALELLRQALAALERASPGPGVWPVTADALTVQALVLRSAGRRQESADALRRVLRVDPTHALDPDRFTPSMIQTFEGLRRELARTRKHALQVRANQPATVYLDGRPAGQTPLTLELAPGTYRLALAAGDRPSFTHPVELKKDAAVTVDLAFEGAVSTSPPLCLAVDDEPAQEGAALALAATVNAEEVLLLRRAPGTAAPALRVALWSVASRSRVRQAEAPLAQAPALARSIVSGAPLQEPSRPAPPSPPSSVSPPTTEAVVATRSTAGAGPLSPARVTSYALLGGGAGLAVAGGVVYALGGADRARLAALYTADAKLYPPSDPRHREALDLIPQVDSRSVVAFGLVGLGLGAAVAGAATWALLPGEAAAVTLVPSPGGAVVTLQGRY